MKRKAKKLRKIQKTYEFTTSDHENIVNLTKYCTDKLASDEWELVALRLVPAVYRFRFKCNKQKVWAILNS